MIGTLGERLGECVGGGGGMRLGGDIDFFHASIRKPSSRGKGEARRVSCVNGGDGAVKVISLEG